MPKITKVYSGKGDDGSTSLGGGQRIAKDALRIDAYGTVDELNAIVGVIMTTGLEPNCQQFLQKIQNELFNLGCDLCILEEDKKNWKVPGIEERHIQQLEEFIDSISEGIPPLENFVLPGGTAGAAHLHVARTVCRRTERIVVALSKQESVGSFTIPYLNRLSALFFAMSRYENYKKQVTEICWNSRA